MGKITKWLKENIVFLIILTAIIITRIFFFSPIRVNGTSMYPTLQDKEFMILNKISLKQGINRFDIVVVQENNKYIIKRVIGLPGESVMYKDSKLYINGKVIEDNYSKTTTNDFDNVVLGENEYFVMGDNRAVSSDSRIIGPVNIKNIKGKTNLIIFPFNKMGTVE
ncbi:MAG: signal peptidase I [Bacteroides xylanisolvens]|nr:signal peptidase I [Bacteroides xylanisolvens]MCI6931579.1 signal peptidase I [Mycoplasmatota bacterium]